MDERGCCIEMGSEDDHAHANANNFGLSYVSADIGSDYWTDRQHTRADSSNFGTNLAADPTADRRANSSDASPNNFPNAAADI